MTSCEAKLASTCTNQSYVRLKYPTSRGQQSVSTCAPCARAWQTKFGATLAGQALTIEEIK